MIKEYKFLGWLTIEYSAANGFSFRLGARGDMSNRPLSAQPSAASAAQVDELSGELSDELSDSATDGPDNRPDNGQTETDDGQEAR